jgi:signal transduction histidine kinase
MKTARKGIYDLGGGPEELPYLSDEAPHQGVAGQEDYEVLLVGDGSENFEKIGYILQGEGGYQVTLAPDAQTAIDALDTEDFDLVITRLARGQLEGLAVLKKAKQASPNTAAIILTSGKEADLPLEAYRIEVDDYIFLPCSVTELCRRVSLSLRGTTVRAKKSESRSGTINERVLNDLRMMFHDVRSCLVSMEATLRLVSRGKYGKMDDGVAERLGDISHKVAKLIGISEDFLGKTFLAESDFEIEPEMLDLRRDIINQVLEELYGDINDRQVIINNRSTLKTGRIPIRGSKFWLKSVFRNLLDNAIKYSGKGGTIEIGLEDQESCWRLNVFNSGPPISEEGRGRLFTKFGRMGNAAEKEKNGGLGLGLYLVQDIIKKHGGDMWYEAEESGSNFVFTLPRC